MKPFFRQIVVASSQQVAAVSIGAVVAYPNVVLEQLRNDTTMPLDMNQLTWIGATHGLAGIPSIMMPTIMQWKGRKISFILTCIFIITGWIWTVAASNAIHIIIGECFHGLGANSLIIVSNSIISETIEPKYRTMTMASYVVFQSFGMCLVGIIGRFLHWKTAGLTVAAPILVALFIGCVSPESPCWLAWKGYQEKCAEAFKWLRGTGDDAQQELNALLYAQKENQALQKRTRTDNNFKNLWSQILRRDFYIPVLHTFVFFWTFYWSGTLVVIIYAMDIIRKATSDETAAFYCTIAVDIAFFVGCLSGTILLNYFKNKAAFLTSRFISVIFLVMFSLVNYLQAVEVLPKESVSLVFCVVGYTLSYSFGVGTLSFSIPVELMPVKHKGLGGALYVIFIGVFNTTSLKFSPYLFLYINLWGTFLLYALHAILGGCYVYMFVPETKGKSLLEIECYYNKNIVNVTPEDKDNCMNLSADVDEE